jgi:hypothetical protein
MKTANVTDGIYLLTADVENILFEGIWPVPEGVSLNSYIVKGEKTALIDGVCDWDTIPVGLRTSKNFVPISLSIPPTREQRCWRLSTASRRMFTS